jgi:hypothetical protein
MYFSWDVREDLAFLFDKVLNHGDTIKRHAYQKVKKVQRKKNKGERKTDTKEGKRPTEKRERKSDTKEGKKD